MRISSIVLCSCFHFLAIVGFCTSLQYTSLPFSPSSLFRVLYCLCLLLFIHCASPSFCYFLLSTSLQSTFVYLLPCNLHIFSFLFLSSYSFRFLNLLFFIHCDSLIFCFLFTANLFLFHMFVSLLHCNLRSCFYFLAINVSSCFIAFFLHILVFS